MIDSLEERRLFSASTIQPLPFLLDFASDRGEVVDKDGQGTGFTRVQANKLGNEYQPSLIDLDMTAGVLKLTSTGTSTAGSNYGTDNTQVDLLETQFDATTSGFKITTRLLGPLTNVAAPSQQGGISFGPDQDNFVKLVAISQPSGTGVQFAEEDGGVNHRVTQMANFSFASVSTLDLTLVGDATLGTVSAYYSINGGAAIKLSSTLTLPASMRDMFFSSAGRAGILVAQKNNLAPITVSFDSFEIDAGTAAVARPSVTATRPADGATNVARDAFVAADVHLPNAGIDPATLTTSTVKLYRTSDGLPVLGVVNTSGGGDAIVYQPSGLLDPSTNYTFEVTSGLKDSTGVAFKPFFSTFTTGNLGGTYDPSLKFEQVALSTASGNTYTCVTMGPDGKLYASTDQGVIQRFAINPDGTLGTAENITTLQTFEGAQRLITGIAFDPAATAANLILWVSHGQYTYNLADDFSGRITKLSGANLQNAQEIITGLPRSVRDHLNNQIVFGPDGALYFGQGSNSAMGSPDTAWGNRAEHLLTAAVLRLDPTKLTGTPLNVQTDSGGTYDPFAANAPLTIYATGLRNAFDLVWTTDGKLLAPTNGSAAGGNTPAGPGVPALTDVQETQPDFLFNVVQGKYYGQPNPLRNEFVLNGGNPTSGIDPNEVLAYPVGIAPPANYGGASYVFGRNYSPDGVIQYHGSALGGLLDNKLMVVQYSGGDNIVFLTLGADGTVTKAESGMPGTTGFVDPLDITEDPNTGYLYVAEYGGQRLTLVRPLTSAPKISISVNALYFNDPYNNASSSAAQRITITNTGAASLTLPSDAFTISGPDAARFTITQKPTLPTTLAPGASVDVFIKYTASVLGIQTATLAIKSNDGTTPVLNVALRGLGTAGVGGVNEPSLQKLMDLFQIPISVGDSNPNDVYLDNPLATPNDSVIAQIFTKAGTGPVTIEPLADFGVGTTSGVATTRFGWYTPGNPQDLRELLTVVGDTSSNSNVQTIRPAVNGVTSFDPGSAAFSFYMQFPSMYPTVVATPGGTMAFGEDALNKLYDPASPTKIRVYVYKDALGNVVPNTYIIAGEDLNAAYDTQDFVAIIRNVNIAPAGPEIGVENLDGAPFSNRLVFNKIQNPDNSAAGKPTNIFHDVAKVRIRNTGTQVLNISSIVLSPQWQLDAPAPSSIDPGSWVDLSVRFIANPGGNTPVVYNGTLVVNSNDADEPAMTIQLSGHWQPESENNKEPSLAQIVAIQGYKTAITYPGQVLNQGGLVARVGDEVLSGYWKRVDSTLPVTVRQLGSYHTQGNSAYLYWYSMGSSTTTTLFNSDGDEGQSMLPHQSDAKIGSIGTTYAAGSFNTNNAFGFKIDGEWSDDGKNVQDQPGGNYGHHVRFWVAKDRNGNIIPNTYIISMDYAGINYDYNDNTYLVSNIKPVSPPSMPQNLIATGGGSSISLTWKANTEVNLAGYNLYRSTSDSGPWTKLNTTWLTSTSFNDLGAMVGINYYQLTAVDTSGNESIPATANAVRSGDTIKPAAPTGLVATGSASGVSLDWADNTEPDLAGYNIYRSDSPSGTFVPVNTSLVTSSNFIDAGAPAGTTSYYRVTAVDTSGNESDYAAASATTPAAGTFSSSDIGNPTPAGSTTTITDAVDYDVMGSGSDIYGNADSFRFAYEQITGDFDIRVRLNSFTNTDPFAKAGLMARESIAANSRHAFITATPGTNGHRFMYRSATGGSTTSGGSGAVNYPNEWLRLKRVGNVFTGYRSTDGMNWTQVGTVTLALPSTLYFGMAVVSKNASQLATAQFRSLGAVVVDAPPAQPTGLVATGGVSNVALDWNDNTDTDLAGYNVYRSDSPTGTFTKLNTSLLTTSAFTDATAPAGVVSYYRVTAVDLGGHESTPATASATRTGDITPPATPTGLVSSHNSTQILLDWADNTDSDLAGYNVYRSTNSSSGFTKINVSLLTSSAFTDTTAPQGVTSYYRVTAVDTSGNESAYTTTSNVRPYSFASTDIGGAKAGTTTTITAGSAYDVAGSGADVWGTSDQFRFVYRAVTGDFDFRVRLAALTNVNGNEKAGLMARESNNANSKNVFAFAWPTKGYRFSARGTTGGSTSAVGSGSTSYPNTWIRLTRAGNTFTAYRSTDGMNWTAYASYTITMNATLNIGMAVTSFTTTTLATAQFRNLSLTEGTANGPDSVLA